MAALHVPLLYIMVNVTGKLVVPHLLLRSVPLQAGLYEVWRRNFLDMIERETRKKQRRLQKEADEKKRSHNVGELVRALNLVHMQGPVFLLLLGLGSAAFVFTVEVTVFYNSLCSHA